MTDEILEKAPKTLGTMLDYLGLESSVKAEEKNGNVVLTVFSEDAGRIIGRKGLTLQSLQLILNRIMSKGNRECPRVFIDVDGYKKPERRSSRGRGPRSEGRGGNRGNRRNNDSDASSAEREELVKQQALDAAKEVKRWGDPVTLPPMNGRDRRIVHLALENDTEIVTESLADESGTSKYKRIVISIKQQ